MEAIFYIVFFLLISMFIVTIVRNVGEWINNNHSPRLSVDAKIVDKRTATHVHNSDGHHHHSHTYFVTFEVQSGDRMEMKVPVREFGLLVVGDEGTLSFQGTRYLGFERNIVE